MRKCLVAVCAALAVSGFATAAPSASITVVVPRLDVAVGPNLTSPDVIAWQTLDTFSGPTLDPILWTAIEGSVSTGAGGLTLVPTPLFGPGHNSAGMRAAFPIPLGASVAVRVPFVIAAATTDIVGSAAELNIDICGTDTATQCDSLGWALTNTFVPPDRATAVSGTFLFRHMDGGSMTLAPTNVAGGELALIYSDGLIRGYANDGSGWQQLGPAFLPPAAWTAASPLRFVIDAGVDVVDEPAPLALLGLGVGMMLVARRRRT